MHARVPSPEDTMFIKGKGLKPALENLYDAERRGQCNM